MNTDSETELEIKHDIKDVDMSDYTNEQWFNEIYDYLELIMTPAALSLLKNH